MILAIWLNQNAKFELKVTSRVEIPRYRDYLAVCWKQLEAVEKTTNFLRMHALENVRLRCTIEVNDLATMYHARKRNLSRLCGRMVAEDVPGGESNVKNTISISPLGKSPLEILHVYLYIQGRSRTDINEMEIPPGVLKYLRKIICRQQSRENPFCNGEVSSILLLKLCNYIRNYE